MRSGIPITVSASDRLRLETIVKDRNAPQKHVLRSRIILLTADGLGTSAIMRVAGKSKTCIWRWQERFFHEGVDGLLHDKTRPPGTAPVAPSRVQEVVALSRNNRVMKLTIEAQAIAKGCGLTVSTVQKIWRDHLLAPHRWRVFKLIYKSLINMKKSGARSPPALDVSFHAYLVPLA